MWYACGVVSWLPEPATVKSGRQIRRFTVNKFKQNIKGKRVKLVDERGGKIVTVVGGHGAYAKTAGRLVRIMDDDGKYSSIHNGYIEKILD